jgi:hypothetical protein
MLWLTVAMGLNYYNPDPLPLLSVETDSGTVRGELITSTDSAWYVATGKDRFRGIPVSRVESSKLKSRDDPDSPTLYELIFD